MPDPVNETSGQAGSRTRRATKSAADAQAELTKAREEADQTARTAAAEQLRYYRRQQVQMASEWAASTPLEVVVAEFCAAMSVTQLEVFNRQIYNPLPKYAMGMAVGPGLPVRHDADDHAARDRDE